MMSTPTSQNDLKNGAQGIKLYGQHEEEDEDPYGDEEDELDQYDDEDEAFEVMKMPQPKKGPAGEGPPQLVEPVIGA